jgi:integrase
MSVYKRQGQTVYSFDFVVKGRRFSGSTGRTSKRESQAEEDRIRAEKSKELDQAEHAHRQPMTWGEACDRYWFEHGQHWKGGGANRMKIQLAWLDAAIGRDIPLTEIRNPMVADLVARRRGEGVAQSTVNRSCTEPLRRILKRAEEVWEEPVGKIKWSLHLLTEPMERVRELSAEEEAKIFESLRPDYHPIVRFALLSGVRQSGCVKLRWTDIDWGNRTIRIRGKGERDYTIPLSKDLRAVLWPLQGQHPSAVFCYVVQRTRDGRKAGTYTPITISGLQSEWGRAKIDAAIENYKFHDNRHTRATTLLRKTGNLKMVQKLLGHSRIETTARYAHVTDDDLLQALDNESHANSHAATPEKSKSRMKSK